MATAPMPIQDHSASNPPRRATCPHCRKPLRVCFCHLIKPVDNQWPLLLVQHLEEARHAIGTARIAQLGLAQCETLSVGDNTVVDAHMLPEGPGDGPVLIYPGEAEDISLLQGSRPRPLIVIDASWRKSRRILYNSPYLRSLPRYSLSPSQPSRYRIRKASSPGLISTLEAVVQVLGTLEQRPQIYQGLLTVMDWMIARQLQHMPGGPGEGPPTE